MITSWIVISLLGLMVFMDGSIARLSLEFYKNSKTDGIAALSSIMFTIRALIGLAAMLIIGGKL